MKKPYNAFDDSAMKDHLVYLYLADIIAEEITTMSWGRSKQVARKVLDELNETGFIKCT